MSPVIATILMVAITVIIAATVYVWVSGFTSHNAAPVRSMSLTNAGVVDSTTYPGSYAKSLTIASATTGMKYGDVTITLNGAPLTFVPTGCATGTIATNAEWATCAGSVDRSAATAIQAGDKLTIRSGTSPSSQTLRVIDATSNVMLVTMTLG